MRDEDDREYDRDFDDDAPSCESDCGYEADARLDLAKWVVEWHSNHDCQTVLDGDIIAEAKRVILERLKGSGK